jgi:hypothetical protein
LDELLPKYARQISSRALDFRAEEYAKQETSMKQIASKTLEFWVKEQSKQETSMKQIVISAVCLLKAQVYVGSRKELQDSLSVFIGSITEQNEPVGDRQG